MAKAKAPQPAAASSSKPKPKAPLKFDDDDDEEYVASSSTLAPKPKLKPNPRDLLEGGASSHINRNTAISRAEKRLQSEALAIDSTAFQYDEVYDHLKAAERKIDEAKKMETTERKSKYMESFLESARRRKMDALHAEEKMMQIEREKEGGEFDDKEKFVTAAYKAQMEEVRRAEEEERIKEGMFIGVEEGHNVDDVEKLKNSKKGPGLTAFYKTMLDDSEAKHAAAVASTSGMVDSGPSLAIKPPTQRDEVMDEEAEYDPFLAREASSKKDRAGPPKLEDDVPDTRKKDLPSGVETNDEGDVVDKRTLLKAGLNITKKPTASLPDSLKTGAKSNTQVEGPYQSRAVGAAASHRERMARERKRLDEQMAAEEEKKIRDQEEKLRLEEEEARKRREGVDGEAERRRLEAKERFLARKRAREQGGDGTNKKAKE